MRATICCLISALLLNQLFPCPSPAASAVPADQETSYQLLEESRDLLDRESGNAAALADLSGSLTTRSRMQGESKRLQALLQQQPQQAKLWYELGRLQEKLEKLAAARQSYKHALSLDPDLNEAKRALTRLEGYRGWNLRLDYNFINDKEYLPAEERFLSRWEEWTVQAQAGRRLSPEQQLSVGVLNGRIRQYSLVFRDNDFQLQRRGVFFQLQSLLVGPLSAQLRLRYEEFSNQGSGYYRLDDKTSLVTGFALLSWRFDADWLSFSYSRERDPDPVFDVANNRVALNIEAQELTGLSWGHALGRDWETALSVYYERYGTTQPDQWNGNLQLLWHPSQQPQLEISLGSGYYTEEEETITNLTIGWKQPLGPRLALDLEYQLEHAVREGSLLNQGELLLSSRWGKQLTLALRTTAGTECGDDEDRFVQLAATMNWVF